MLQRAASNAYSWWWASHIRTKQSKWLEQNLQDFGEKVQSVLKLIEEDGDSFAKRAEMYYKKRPELIHFVEEAYRAYRALAERYDHISTELQNANNTIASVFPEQVQFAMEDDEYESASKVPRKGTEASKGNIPQVPKIPKELKGAVTSDTKHLQPKKPTKTTKKTTVVKSGLSKAEGLKKAGRLQKQILALQTEKEFVKSSYESGLAKYWEIEETITEMQDQVCSLQDEFGASTVIEDDEARKLMATAALQSCQDTLTRLEEKQEKSAEAARVESERINHAREKLKSLKDNYLHGEVNQENPKSRDESVSAVGKMKSLDQEPSAGTQEKQELEILRAKISEHFDVGSNESFSVSELAEKIDELVNKVISLEAAVSSQTALIQRLRTETDELQAQIGILQNDKASLIDEKNDSRDKLRQMEEKLLGLQELNQSVKVQSNNLQSHFTEAHCNLDHLSKKLHDVKPDEELQATRQKELGIPVEDKQQQEVNGQEGSLKTEGEIQKPRKLKSQDGFRGLEGELKLDDIPTEPWNAKSHKETQKPPELKSQEAFRGLESALKLDDIPDDIPTESLNAKPHKEIEKPPELKPQEAFRGLESALKLGGIPTEPPNAKPHKELKVSGSFQQENESVAKVSVGELTVKGGPNGDDLKVSGGSLKESEGRTSALDPDWKLDEWQEKTNKNFEVSGSSQKGNATTNQKEEEALKEQDLSISNRNQMDNVSPLQIDNRLEQSHEVRMEEKYNKQASSKTADGLLPDETKEQETYEPDWKHMFTNGMENREQFLLTEYTTALRNYKDVKKKLGEAEKKKAEDHKNGDGLFDMTLQLKELKNANAKKDEQIKILRQKLSLLQISLGEDNVSENSTLTEFSIMETDITMDQSEMPEIEQKFRSSIDEVLEENLDFWLRFSSTFHQIQKFETETKDLQSELVKLEQKQKRQDANGSGHDLSLKSDAKPLYKHLREIHTELGVWLEKSVLLKDELKSRFSSLCDIQEEITGALKASAEDDDFTFTTYQAAKFQGEILNMKQENNKVADELQAGLDHVTTLQLEVERTLARLNDEFKLSGSRHQQNMQMHRSDSRGTVPLRSFIFGNKPKKQKHSLFSCVHPVLHRKYNGFKGI